MFRFISLEITNKNRDICITGKLYFRFLATGQTTLLIEKLPLRKRYIFLNHMKHIQCSIFFLTEKQLFLLLVLYIRTPTTNKTATERTMQASPAGITGLQSTSTTTKPVRPSAEPVHGAHVHPGKYRHTRFFVSLIAQSLHCQRKSSHFQPQCLYLSPHLSPLISASAATLPRHLPPSFLPGFSSVPMGLPFICC